MPLLSAHQAAHRMGVKVETVYAYASRGVLRRFTGDDGRSSWFDERDVEALARRGRPRRSTRATSLDLLIETRLTSISNHGVRYRGIPSAELARTATFEQVAELLWLGVLPEHHERWSGSVVPVAADVGVAQRIRLIVATLVPPTAPQTAFPAEEVAAIGRSLIATVVDSLGRSPASGHVLSAPNPTNRVGSRTQNTAIPAFTLPAGGPVRRSTIAGRLWTGLSDRRPAPGVLAAVNATLVLLADHELAASTLAARVAASARAHPAAAALAGLGSLQGYLHGGATRPARELLEDAMEHGARAAVDNAVARQPRVAGFGHRVYPGIDPRAAVLLDLLRPLPSSRRVLTVADDLVAVVAERTGRAPNVDFALAAVTRVAGFAPEAGEALMAVARLAGWLAHALEEYGEAPLRFRPRASYIGP